MDIDPVFDNHALEFEICRKWIISEAGRQTKTDNPDGYKNVLLHGKMHQQAMQPPPPQPPLPEPPKINYSIKADLTDPDARALFEKTQQLPMMPKPMQDALQAQAQSGGDATPGKKPNPLTQEAPIMGNQNVSTVQ